MIVTTMRQAITAARPTSAPSMTLMSAFVIIFFVIVLRTLLLFFPQVFCDLARCRNFQSACVEQAHLTMIMGVSLIAFVTNDAIDCCAAHPELAFLWCFFFHAFRVSEMR